MTATAVIDATTGATSWADRVDEMRCHETAWLETRRRELVQEQRVLHLEELAVLRVLDERATSPHEAATTMTGNDGVSGRTADDSVRVARALEQLPALADAAQDGALSWDQLKPLTELADSSSDAEWARRGRNYAPTDLARMARLKKGATDADAVRRRERRSFRWWWEEDGGMLGVRGSIPDVDGALAKAVFEHMTDKMKPAKGEAWDSREHRGADAFVELCRSYANMHPTVRSKPVAVLHINADGTGEVDGIPVPAATVTSVVNDARIRTQDHAAAPVDHGNTRDVPAALRREIAHRDHHCRYPGCTRTFGLEIHHMTPVAWGGHTISTDLVLLCPLHHPRMEPHGTERLTGNADRPHGLELIEVARRPRAGPAP